MKTKTRREFMGSLAAAGALAGRALARPQDRKLRLGLIGCGWYGMVDLKAAFKAGGIEAAALCDVDSAHLAQCADEVEKLQGARPRTFKDYRELIALPGLDAAIIATPPHWHALPFIAACEKGLPIYCEKPLAYDIREGQAMVAAARRSGQPVQIGFQRRQADCFQDSAAYVRSGKPGRVIQVEAQIHYKAVMLDNTPQDPPASLDWDLWCGPAPRLPYTPNIGHRSWRLEKEYGNGHLVDWGIHLMDAVRIALEESTPRGVAATGGLFQLKGKITTPDMLTASFDFEKCPVVWRHRLWGAAEYSPEVSNGIFYYCEKETVFATDGRWLVIPEGKGERREMPARLKGDEHQARHVAEFLTALRERRQPSCLPPDAADSAATVQLAMISYYTGTMVKWDRARRQILENPPAARLLKREYRKPWAHPYSG